MKDDKKKHPNDRSKMDQSKEEKRKKAAEPSTESANPPRTTTRGMTSPKFGSAGSGGAELEPGPEKD